MDISLFLTNVGSLCLGMTLALVLFFIVAGRHSGASGIEGCLMALLSVSGFSIAIFFYVWAMKICLGHEDLGREERINHEYIN